MGIHESGENYLEALLKLKENQDTVRSIDIAKELGFSKPSVSRAIKKLKQNSYIIVNDNGSLEFTIKGYDVAKTIYERHQFFSEFLSYLGVDQVVAENDACRIEHVLSEESFEAVKNFVILKRNQKCK